jgi:hypothetical protein
MRLAAAAFLLFCGCAPARPAGFTVEAVLRDGRTVAGRLDTETIPLTLAVAGGEDVEIELRAPARWSSLSTAAQVDWIPERGAYCIRATDYTAEAVEIRSPLKIREDAGGPVELKWRDVLSARFSVTK